MTYQIRPSLEAQIILCPVGTRIKVLTNQNDHNYMIGNVYTVVEQLLDIWARSDNVLRLRCEDNKGWRGNKLRFDDLKILHKPSLQEMYQDVMG